jgi:hypothetical protein
MTAAETEGVGKEERVQEDKEEKSVLSSFESLLGRQATDKEKIHLLRAKSVLKLHENDALWLILMSLEDYAYRFDLIPEKVQKNTAALVEEHKKILEAEAVAAAQRTQEKIADALAKRVEATIFQTARTKYIMSLGWTVIALVLLSVISFTSGAVMGSGRIPWWARPAQGMTSAEVFLSSILAAPAGWVFSLLAVPCTVCYLRGLKLDELEGREKVMRIAKAALSVFLTALSLIGAFIW